MITYLITGGAGFIGINFIKYLLKKNEKKQIIVLDKLTYASNINALKDEIMYDNIIFIKGDICNLKLINDIFAKYNIDYVVNFAAESHVDRSIANPNIFIETNVLGTNNLLEVARKYWSISKNEFKPNKKFLQISTDEVYGSLDIEYSTALINENGTNRTYGSTFFKENDILRPSSPYSASKAAADTIAMSYYYTYNFPILISRSTNNYGPYQHGEKFIPLSILKLFNNEKVTIYGQGENVRDWIYVEDNCSALYSILHFGELGEIYNIGIHNEEKNIELIKYLIRKIKNNENYMDYIEFVADRLGHDKRYAIDNTKILNKLNWKPIYSFDEAINKTIYYYYEQFQNKIIK